MSVVFELSQATVAKLEYKPGDTFVIQCEQVLNESQKSLIAKFWEEKLPDTTLIVLDGSVKLTKLELIE